MGVLRINGYTKFFGLRGGRYNFRDFKGKVRGKLSQPEYDSYINGIDICVFIDLDRDPVDAAFFLNHGCCPFKSMSGKWKGIMYIKGDGKNITDAAIRDTVKHVFGDEWFKKMDKQAFRHSFIHPSQFESISNHVFEKHHVITDCRSWRMKDIPDLTDDPILNFVIAFAASHEHWKDESIYLPIAYMAETYGCSKSTIQRKVREAIDKGFISVVSNSYRIGFFSKMFRLTEKTIKALGKSLTYCSQKSLNYIPDGEWWKHLLPQMRFFESFTEALNWFHSLPNHNARGKDRFGKLKSAWRHHAKANGLNELCEA